MSIHDLSHPRHRFNVLAEADSARVPLLAHSPEEIAMVAQVRRETFCVEQGYSEDDIAVYTGTRDHHLLILQDEQPVATHTWQLGFQPGDLRFEQHFPLDMFYSRYGCLAFYSKGAVLRELRRSNVANLMYELGYWKCVEQGARYLVTDCLVSNKVSRTIFPKLGFRCIGEATKGNLGEVLVWGMSIEECRYALAHTIREAG